MMHTAMRADDAGRIVLVGTYRPENADWIVAKRLYNLPLPKCGKLAFHERVGGIVLFAEGARPLAFKARFKEVVDRAKLAATGYALAGPTKAHGEAYALYELTEATTPLKLLGRKTAEVYVCSSRCPVVRIDAAFYAKPYPKTGGRSMPFVFDSLRPYIEKGLTATVFDPVQMDDMRETMENQIVVYQPNETMRLDVRVEKETVWLNQSRLGELFGVDRTVVNRHINNIYKTGELDAASTCAKIAQVQNEGGRMISRVVPFYNLDMIIAVGYRVNSLRATKFRQWATGVLREYLLKGYAVNQRLNLLEDRIDRRLAGHEERLSTLEGKVDFFVQTKEPPLQGVFYDGQLWDACSLVERLIARAKKSILLIDSWVGTGTLDVLAKKRKGVEVKVVTSVRDNKVADSDVAKFNAQYGGLSMKTSAAFHDRFLVLDDKELYLIGASLKDLGKKCFAFTKLDVGEIRGLKARV